MRDAGSVLQFELARRAVDRGWITREQVEAALIRTDTEGGRLLDHLALTEQQIRDLQTLAPPVPPEAAEAMRDPARRVGRYVMIEPLRAGGQGRVVKAWDPLGRWVALKFLKRSDDEIARAFFRREAQLVASLDHPNIAKVFAVGEHEGEPFIAMQFVDGGTLSGAKLRLDQKVDAVFRAGEALRYAHTRGVIHRDVKPSNVMIDREGHVYVMDFGLAKEFAVPGESLTQSHMTIGTPQYMAPEQALGKATTRSDVYGLGAVLYELLSGRPPFVGDTPAEILQQVFQEDVVWPRKLNPGIPADLEAILLRALEKDPARRYPDVAALLEDLEAFRAGNPIVHARRPTLAYVLGKRIRKNPLLSAALAAGLGLAVFGIVTIVQRNAALEAQLRAERQAEATREIDAANKRFQAGNLARCLEHARRAQELRPDLAGGWYWEARCLIREYAAYQRVPVPWVSEGIVEFLPPSEEPAAARAIRETAEEIVRRMGSGEGWEESGVRGIVLVLQGRYAEGERALETSLADPRAQWDAEARRYLALSRYFQRRFADAAADASILGEPAGRELFIRALEGAALEDDVRGRSARALKRLALAESLAGLHGSVNLCSSVLVRRGDVELRRGRSDAAETAYRAALASAADDFHRAEALVALSRWDERRGRREEGAARVREAIAAYTAAIEADPAFHGARVRRGFARGRLWELSNVGHRESLADLEEVAKSMPGPAIELLIFRLRGDPSYEERVAAQDRLVRKYPHYLPVHLRRSYEHLNYAQYLWSARRENPDDAFRKALADCDHVLSVNPEYADGYFHRAHVYANWGDYVEIHGGDPTPLYERCFADAGKAVEVNPEMFEALTLRASKRHSLAGYRWRKGGDPRPDWQAALEELARSMEINPEHLTTYRVRALIHLGRSRFFDADAGAALAEADLGLQACDLDGREWTERPYPVEQRCHLRLRRGLLLRRQARADEARKEFESCVEEATAILPKEPASGAYNTTLGALTVARARALCQLGRHEEARRDFEDAARHYRDASADPLLTECRTH